LKKVGSFFFRKKKREKKREEKREKIGKKAKTD